MITHRTAPLTPAQQEVLDAWQLDPASPVFRVADVLEITGQVDVESFVGAIGTTLAETQALQWQVLDGPDGWHQRFTGATTTVELRDVRMADDPAGVVSAWIDADLAVDDGQFGDAQVVWRIADDLVWWYQRYHHVRVDGWAVAAITRRAVRHYRAVTSAAPEPEPFGDLEAAWSDDVSWSASEAADIAATWFADRLAGARPTPISGSISPAARRPRRQPVLLEHPAREALAELTAADRRITWADVLIAAHAAWVGRTTGRDDVVIALPMTARTGPASLVPSMAVNVMPLRLSVPLTSSLHELSWEAARAVSSLRRHQRLRGAGAADVDLLRGPAVNIKPFVEPFELGAARGYLRGLETGPVDDLDLVIVPAPDGTIALTFEANPDLHDVADLARHADAFSVFLASALAAPERPTGQIALAGADSEASGGRLIEPVDVSTRFAQTVRATPDLIAVRCGTDQMTFAELSSKVDNWARVLAGAGAGPEAVVAIALERGVDVVVAILAALECGAAFVPIDLSYPDERIDGLLEDTRPVAVVTRPDHRLAGHPGALTVADHELTGAAATDLDANRQHPNAVAYIVHTSGSTGRPKGVMVSRESLAFFSTHHGEGLFADVASTVGRRLRAAHTASFSFDSSWEQLVWLLHGHELVIYDEDDRRDAHELVLAIDRDRIDTLDVTPSMAVALLAEGLLDVDHVPSLFLIGGEAATEQLWRRLADAPMRSYNFYGPTEATVDALGAAVVGDRPTIGRALDSTAARILDGALQPVPAGSTGELYLAGPHLARGYTDRPGLTAERFIADPHGVAGTRMYRTGDVARREADGSVTYLGRGDDQVKIRGHRIELGEVIAALESLPQVRQAHAAAQGDPARLVGWVTAARGTDPVDLRAALATKVPAHLVPAVVVVVDSFDQTVQGKIDVRALPAPELADGAHIDPADAREAAVVEAMASALRVDRVSVTADFFVMGGDSISAIAVAAHLRTAGWESRPRDLFRARTARDLAPELSASSTARIVGDDPIGRAPLSPVAAASIAQAGAHLAGYAQHTCLRIPAHLGDDEISAMLITVIRRHAALRVRLDGNELEFRAAGDETVAVRSGVDRASLVDELIGTLDPWAGRVVAAGRIRAGESDRLVLVVHHLAVDAVSWRVLLSEIAALLGHRELPAVAPTSWRAHLTTLASADHTADLAHWKSVSSAHDRGAALAPADSDTAGTTVRETVEVDPDTSRAVLNILPATHGTRPDVVLAAAAALAVERWAGHAAGERTVLLGWESIGREPASRSHEIAGTLGWFTEEFTVAVCLRGAAHAESALKAAQQARLEVPAEGRGHCLSPASPRILVNYLGRFSTADDLLVDQVPFVTTVPSGFGLVHGVELNVFVTSDDRLAVEWTVAGSLTHHTAALRAAFHEALGELAALADRPVAGTLVPAACTLPGVDQATIDAVERETGALVDIAPLPPLAEGLLVHALSGDNVYETLTTIHLGGEVDIARLHAAIAAVTARHPQLDARIVADRFGRPAQLVPRDPRVEIVSADTVDQPFDVTQGPLVRWAIVETASGADVLIGAHHLVADGWSTPLLVRDLLTAYRGGDLGSSASGWAAMRRYLQLLLTDDVPTARQVWAAHLDGVRTGSLVAPDLTAGSATQTRPVNLPDDLADRLAARVRAAGLTFSSALGTAWAYALGRALGTTDVVFGTTVAGRSADVPGIDEVVGLLSQTLPVRIALRGDDTWSAVVARTGLERAELGEVERTSLTDIAEAVGVPDLFDTLVVVENYPEITDVADGVQLLDIGNAGGTHYPLTLTALPGAGIRLVLDVDPARVPSTVVDGITADLVLALTRIADAPNEPVGVIGSPHVADGRRGSDPAPLPDPIDAFVAAAGLRADEPAVISSAGSLTFAELSVRAESLRVALAEAGCRPGDLIGIAVPRTPDMLVAVLGVLAGGHAYLPLDLEHPEQRRRDVVEDAAPTLVIVTDDADWLEGLAPTIALPSVESIKPLRVVPVPSASAAYVIHTSGSTGRPKGVVIERRTMARHLAGLRAERERAVVPDVAARHGRDRVHALLSASLSFDTSLGQLHWLFAGHTLVLADSDERRDPVAILELARAWGLDVADVAPILGEQLADVGLLDGPDRLSLLYLGGEAVPPATWARLRTSASPVLNLYGPTESTVDALGAELSVAETPVIGHPVAGVEAHVLDGFLRAAAVGVEGELYLGGEQLARGYLGRPGLTAERFVAHPWQSGRRLYRTGDVVRRRADGLVEFVGRSDDQVKIGGHRIELGEATALVAAVPGVAAAVVLADPPGAVAHRLLAYVIASPGTDRAELPEQVREHLLQEVPHHLIPAAVVVLDAMPRTVNDKVDLARLRTIEIAATDRGAARVPPSTPAEVAVAAAVRAVLDVSRPSMDDDFFALGGHSLTALRMLAAMRATGFTLGVRDVFNGRRLDRIAAAAEPISAVGSEPRADADVLRRLLLEGGVAGVSDAQRRLLFLAEVEGPSPTWNVPVVHRISGPVDVDQLRSAWAALSDRHAVLRTRFGRIDGRFTAEVLPQGSGAEVAVLDVAEIDAAVRAAEAEPFDVFSAPPVRLSLISTSAAEHALVLCGHHALLDDWSVGLLTTELGTLMTGGVLAPLPDAAQHIAAHLTVDDTATVDPVHAEFWRTTLDGLAAEIELPTDRIRPEQASYCAHAVTVPLDPALWADLRSLGGRDGLSPLMILQTAVATLLRGLGAGPDICLGMPVARRNTVDSAATVGYLIDTVPVRLDVSGAGSFAAVAARTRDAVLAAVDHADLAFERIVEIMAPPRSWSRHPVFQVMVSAEDGGGASLRLPGAAATRAEPLSDTARLDLAVRLVESPDAAPHLQVTAAADLFGPDTVDRLARRLLSWLRRVVARPDTSFAELDLLLDDERVLAVADHVRRETAPEGVMRRFAAHVRATPDALALVSGSESLDYKTLADRAASLAEQLRSRGIGSDDVVAIAVPRGTELVVALLGTLGAGATYLPLDDHYPADRIADMLDDADPRLVLVTPSTSGIGVGRPELDVAALADVRPTAPAADSLDVSSSANGAYTIYTSGSTGRPKGVIIDSDAMAAFVDHVASELALRPTDRFVAVTTISFDIAVLEIFVPLVSGAAVVLADATEVRDPDLLVALLRSVGGTHMQATPSLWRPVLDAHPDAFGGVTALVGGEALPPDLADIMTGACALVINEYGPTEVTVWATSSDVTAARSVGEPVTIGRPYVDVGVLVLDDLLRPVPDGVPGELYLAGAQLARGYHNRLSLTAERFTARPGGEPGDRMYRTGDLVWRDADGGLHFIRRVDDQVKVLGHRIELGEVETHLGRLPGVDVAAAVVRSDDDGTGRLLGYVVPDRTATLDPADLRALLGKKVPAHLVPQHITVVDDLPLTLNGKIDRLRLPDPVVATSTVGREPVGEAERIVCAAAAEVLGLGAVGPADAFFELGGDSITSIRLVAAAKQAGLRFTPRDVFIHSDLAGLALAGELVTDAAPTDAAPTDLAPTDGSRRRPRRTRVALGADDLARIDSLMGGPR